MAMKVYLLDNGTLLLDQSFATWNHGQGIEFRFRSTPFSSTIPTARS